VKWASQMLIAYEQHEIELLPSEVAHYRAVVEADYQHKVRESHEFLDEVLRANQRGEIEEEGYPDTDDAREHVGGWQWVKRWVAQKLQALSYRLYQDVP
jgi:hypothetical protein